MSNRTRVLFKNPGDNCMITRPTQSNNTNLFWVDDHIIRRWRQEQPRHFSHNTCVLLERGAHTA